MELPAIVSDLTGKPIETPGRIEAYRTFIPGSALKSPSGCSRTLVDFGQDELGGDCLCFSLAIGQHDLGFEDPFDTLCLREHVQGLRDQGRLAEVYGDELANEIERILLEIEGISCADDSDEDTPRLPAFESIELTDPLVTRKLNRMRTSGASRGWKKPIPCEVD